MAEKIGVYFDKSSIGPLLDVEELTEFVENKWSEICPVVKAHPLLPSDDGVKMIQADIDAGEIDAVLICGPTPRADWHAYDFGSNIPVDRVNLREFVVMSYEEPDGTRVDADAEEAPAAMVQMAKDYVNMGVLKMRSTKNPEPEDIEVTRTVLVLGGGWTGLSAALDVAAAGTDVILVEKTGELGGQAKKWHKALPMQYPHTEITDSGIEAKIEAVNNSDKITVMTNAALSALKGAPGKYTAVINGSDYAVGSVILATGWVPQDPKILEPLGYGKFKNVITTQDMEELMAKGEILSPNDGRPAKRVAFILNTEITEPEDLYQFGDRSCDEVPQNLVEKEVEEGEEEPKYVHEDLESERHLPYSKSVNTMVALKQAKYIREKFGDGLVYVLYDHMVVPGIYERFYKAAQDDPGIMLTKAAITGISQDEEGTLLIRAGNTLFGNEEVEIAADLVVLPTGIVPSTAKDPIVNLEYRQGPNFPDLELFDGFADSNYICFPYETRRTGLYAAGCVRQPMLMDSAEEDATGAALKAIQCIESSDRGVAVHPRSGDLTFPVFNFVRCTQCKRCTEECPFGALDDDEKGTPLPNPTRCRRCGTCMGACPERVISFDNYGIGMMSDVVKGFEIPDTIEEGGPRVLILACENDAYPALDMAAARGHSWSQYVRIVPVRCLGSVNSIWIKDVMSKGADGVLLLGCKYGDDYQCHFVKGSEICNRRMENIAETLNQLGVEPERVHQYEVAIDEYDKVPGMIDEFLKMVLKLGPNPFKGY